MKRLMIAVMVVCVLPMAVRADWEPGDPHKMHFPQLPDLSPSGMDVLDSPGWPEETIDDGTGGQITLPAIPQKMLADDWQCSATGLVTDIHIWGSWLGDRYPVMPDPELLQDLCFRLTIWANNPVGPNGWSEPAGMEPLREYWFDPLRYVSREYAFDLQESFYDPNERMIIGNDTVCWQYNFKIDPADAFWQDEGMIYWLGVEAYYPMRQIIVVDDPPGEPTLLIEEYRWGWKTSQDKFMDDAVFRDFEEDIGGTGQWGPWIELLGPDYESLDLAFVITPEPATMGLLSLGLVGLVARRRRRK